MKIFIDAGHNHSGYDTGAQGHGLREQDVTFHIAKKLGSLLSKHKDLVIKYSRETLETNIGTSTNSSLITRCQMANTFSADLFISIHCNAFNSPSAHGTECLVYSDGGEAAALARKIHYQLVGLDLYDRCQSFPVGIKVRPNLVVLKNTNMPAVIVETAFITNTHDAEVLELQQNEIAEAIYKGVVEHLGISIEVPKQHWAQSFFNYLTTNGISISETRFDDPITRGEAFKLLADVLFRARKE